MKKTNIFLSIFILYIMLNMVLFPQTYITASLNGISAWAFNVLPSVLPFIVFTKLLSSMGFTKKITKIFAKPCQKLFACPPQSSFVFLSSIISGYPVGASMTADLYERGQISRSDALKMCSFSSTSGPMFIIGGVGIGMIGGAKWGYIILISHILGAILNGLLYRNLSAKEDRQYSPKNSLSSKNDLSSIILDSALSLISVGAIITLFFVIITSLSPILNMFPPQISSFLAGLVEITKGCFDISKALSPQLATIVCTFVISFGGISTILQSLTLLNRIKMPTKLFCQQKFTHAIFATLISSIIVLIV